VSLLGTHGGTVVERFARRHGAGAVPDGAARYRDALPLSRPGPGEQYAFEVDLDACTGCKACVAACRSLNGLDPDESWRTTTVLWSADPARPALQTVTAACHHCVEPACLAGCPVDAYAKDPATGIVVHLDDQCIGCRYCTLTCPYEVPRYSPARGIVRKCDMCRGRLAAGEEPACVQACPNGAIAVRVVGVAAVAAAAADPAAALFPGAPPSSVTLPTTRYRTRRDLAALATAGADRAEPAESHPPLAVMLVLTQLAVGALVTGVVLDAAAGRGAAGPATPATAALAGAVALAASVVHLGRPRHALRAVLGLRHSWLSREIVAFGAFAALAPAHALARWWASAGAGRTAAATGALATLAGLAGVACSVMIYAVTGRPWWRPARTAASFALTTVACGTAVVLAAEATTTGVPHRALAAVAAVATLASAGLDAAVLACARRRGGHLAAPAALLGAGGPLAGLARLRAALAVAGGGAVALAARLAPGGTALAAAAAGALLVTAAALVERHLFFCAGVAQRPAGGAR
jgi:Fe-S-cluster-containing dehydrogenase component/DMSO reductase anchor subunit